MRTIFEVSYRAVIGSFGFGRAWQTTRRYTRSTYGTPRTGIHVFRGAAVYGLMPSGRGTMLHIERVGLTARAELLYRCVSNSCIYLRAEPRGTPVVETLALFSAPQTLLTCFRSPLFVPEEISALGSVELQASIRPQAVNINIWAPRHAGYMRSYSMTAYTPFTPI